MIKQEELKKFQDAEAKLKSKRELMKLAEAKVKDMEEELIHRLSVKNERVEKGKILAEIIEKLKRANISWKDELIKVKGHAYVQNLLSKAVRDSCFQLELKERAEG